MVVALVCLPLVYLVVRVVDGGVDAWVVLGRARILELVGNTALLVVLVTGAALALGVPLAWLVTRTDLPGRRLWAVAAALPLVIPSYVAALVLLAAFGPRGFLQQVLLGGGDGVGGPVGDARDGPLGAAAGPDDEALVPREVAEVLGSHRGAGCGGG